MSSGKLLLDLKNTGKKAFLQFGGQGSPYLKEVSKLYEDASLKKFFEVCFDGLNTFQKNLESLEPLFSKGMDLKSWIEKPDSAPDESYLSRGSVSIAMIFIAQSANYHKFTLSGYSPSEFFPYVAGTSGHSQGIHGAFLASLGKEGDEYYKTLYDFMQYTCYMGFRAQETYTRFDLEPSVIQECEAVGDKSPSPMVACIGYTKEQLTSRVNFFNDENSPSNKDKIYISLYNTPTSMIISGQPERLIAFRKKNKPEMDELKCKYVYLRTTAPFHCPHTKSSTERFNGDLKQKFSFPYTTKDIKIPLYSFCDGRNIQKDTANVAEVMFREIVVENLHWNLAVSAFTNGDNVSTAIDFGPSKTVASLTQGNLPEGSNKTVLCLSNPKDLKNLF
jgi:malonyl CoA-acyl carrier protein transacylase